MDYQIKFSVVFEGFFFIFGKSRDVYFDVSYVSDDVSRTKRTIKGTKRQNKYLFATRKF